VGSLAPRSHDFTAAACAQLGVAAPPEWLNALAQTAASGASMFGMMHVPPAALQKPPARRRSQPPRASPRLSSIDDRPHAQSGTTFESAARRGV